MIKYDEHKGWFAAKQVLKKKNTPAIPFYSHHRDVVVGEDVPEHSFGTTSNYCQVTWECEKPQCHLFWSSRETVEEEPLDGNYNGKEEYHQGEGFQRKSNAMFKLTRGGLIKDDDLRRRHQPHPSPWAQDHGRSGRSCLGPNSRSLTCFRLNILIMIVDATAVQ